jgi:hypothetical protein
MELRTKLATPEESGGPGVYGPYKGFTDMHAKLTILLNSPLPTATDEVQAILGEEMTFDDLTRICAKIYMEKGKQELIGTMAATTMLQKQSSAALQAPQPGQQPGQPGQQSQQPGPPGQPPQGQQAALPQ